jgi:hypothetical protein
MTSPDQSLRDLDDSVTNVIEAVGARFTFTSTHLIVVLPESDVVLLNMPIADLRRIQFDIERDRAATLVIVSRDAHHLPQVLAVPPGQYEAAGVALARMGRLIYNERDGIDGEGGQG